MYNGIGLQTARGSGTNGFVQKNMSFLPKKTKVLYYEKPVDDPRKLDSYVREPNKEIVEHKRKRLIELKCMEYRDSLEAKGISPDDIESKVSDLRNRLLDEEAKNREISKAKGDSSEKMEDEHGNSMRSEMLRKALGISENFERGSAFNFEEQAEERKLMSAMREEEKRKRDEQKVERRKLPVYEVPQDNEKSKSHSSNLRGRRSPSQSTHDNRSPSPKKRRRRRSRSQSPKRSRERRPHHSSRTSKKNRSRSRS